MSLLWKNAAAFQREGMAWHVKPGEEGSAKRAKSVRDAGFAGYTWYSEGRRDTENELRGHDPHSLDAHSWENTPDMEDDELMDFVHHHGTNKRFWQKHADFGPVDIRQPVHATQSHVSQDHIDKYLGNSSATTHEDRGDGGYLGDEAPLMVTVDGRLHTIEGHHRVAAALQRGDSHIHAYHYDADKHGGLPDEHGNMPDDEDYEDYWDYH